ncbi:hypothetical protein Droror1_Dr00013841 [Drosera rotundifolia]
MIIPKSFLTTENIFKNRCRRKSGRLAAGWWQRRSVAGSREARWRCGEFDGVRRLRWRAMKGGGRRWWEAAGDGGRRLAATEAAGLAVGDLDGGGDWLGGMEMRLWGKERGEKREW